MRFHFDGLDIGEHVQPEEGHDSDEGHSQPRRHKHKVNKLKKEKSYKNTYYKLNDITCTGSQKMQSRRNVVTPFC